MSVQRASALLDLGRPGEALDALGPDADSALGHGVRALALLRLDRLPEAEVAAAAARAAEPAEELGSRLGALVALRRGELRRAVALAGEAVRLAPDEPAVHHVAALTLLEVGDVARAAEHAEQLLRLAPDEAASHQTSGRVLLAEHRDADAEAALRSALALDPQDDEAMALLAEATARQGRAQEADALRLSALRADPQDVRHQRSLLARGGRVAGGVAGIGLAKAFGITLAIRAAAHLPGLGGTVLALLVAGYVAAFVVSRPRRARRGRELPAPVWQGLRPVRRNADLQWLAWPAALALVVALPAAALQALEGRDPGPLLVLAVVGLLVLAACWLLRAGTARDTGLRDVAHMVRLGRRYLWERYRASRERHARERRARRA